MCPNSAASFRDRVRRWRRGLQPDPFLLLLLVVSLFPLGPLLQPGYQWDAHDARHSVYFLFELDRGIRDGLLYPRWQPDFAFGYGYPMFNIYGPLSLYIGEAFHLLGAGFADAVKIVFGLSIVASGLAMYGFVKQVAGRRAALVAGVAYMVIPYRLVDLYVRAALAEAVAYVFVPLVLWGAWSALHRPRWASVVGLGLAYAALLFTHPISGLLLSLVLLALGAVLALGRVGDEQPWRELSRESVLPWLGHLGHVLAPLAAGLALGLGLCAFFLVPAMTESRYVRVDQWYGGRYAWGGDFVEPFQLLSPRWGFGTSVPGPDDDVSFQLGAVPVVLSLVAAARLLARGRSRSRPGQAEEGERWPPSLRRLAALFAVLTVVAVFLMLAWSAPLWAALPLVRLAQFPWRLLALTVVSMAFLCGTVAWGARSPSDPLDPGLLALVALLVLGSLPFMRAEMSQREVSLAGLMQFQQSSDEMTGSTAWVRRIPAWSPMADYYIAGEPLTSKIDYSYLYRQQGYPVAQTLELHTDRELVDYSALQPALITFNTFYYPGWRAYLLDPQTDAVLGELPIALRGELGLITVRVPAGVGRVLLRFESTPVRTVSAGLSLAALGLVLLGSAAAAVWSRPRRGTPRPGGSAR